MIIAIDGPAASGKGTVARRLARHFGLPHLDTGLLYRATGLSVLRANADPQDPVAAAAAAQAALSLDQEDPDLRSEAAGAAASKVAMIPEVRAALLQLQRTFSQQHGGAVLDGRDIASVVCPTADHKLYVTADVETRAKRRLKELQTSQDESIYSRVLADLRERDARDSTRDVAPLVASEDAYFLDTTALDADAAFAAALAYVVSRTRFGK